jgi:hypothetical protein
MHEVPTTSNRTLAGSVTRPTCQVFVGISAFWTAAGLIDPTNELLLWAGVPVAIAISTLARRTEQLRMPTVVNTMSTYVTLAMTEGGASHWAMGSPELLRTKLLILTLLGAATATREIRARAIETARIARKASKTVPQIGRHPTPAARHRPARRRHTTSRPTHPRPRRTAGTRPRQVPRAHHPRKARRTVTKGHTR